MKKEKRAIEYSHVSKILLWLIVSVSFDLLGLLSLSGSGWNSNAIIMMSLGIISGVSMLGILFFAGATVFISPSHTQIEYENYPKLILKQFLLFLSISTVYLMLLSIATFNTLQRFGEAGAVVAPEILYGSLLATPFIALFYCSIATGIVILVDDWRMTLLIGCILFFLGNLFFGMPGNDAQFPEISLFSPSHFYRGMIFLCIGFLTTIPHTLSIWGGVVSSSAMVLPILFYTILTLTSIRIIKVYGPQNLHNRQLQTLTGSIEENEGEHLKAFQLRSQLKSRRKSVLVGFLIVSLLLPITGFTYTSVRTPESFTVVYEEVLEPTNGDLFYGSFVTEESIPKTTRWIGFPIIVLDWGLAPSPIQFEYVFGIGTTGDFLSMNENDRWRQAQSTNLEHKTTEYHVQEYTGIDEGAGGYYWAFRFVGNDWTSDLGSIVVRISVVLREKSDMS
ncbi:MAG: hypothetical protein ACTSV2_05195 [Candidatus Thorarchaeota archaeon]